MKRKNSPLAARFSSEVEELLEDLSKLSKKEQGAILRAPVCPHFVSEADNPSYPFITPIYEKIVPKKIRERISGFIGRYIPKRSTNQNYD